MNLESTFLSHIYLEGIPIIDRSIPKNSYVPIDLSLNNTDLKHFDVGCYKSWDYYIKNYLQNRNAEVAFGGYLEKRNLYDRSLYFSKSTNKKERNIHLGIDLWTNAGTQVLAAFNGEIHSFNNNTNHGDYGPTIILKHQLHGLVFHTLYGHLSMDSITKLKVGDTVRQGEVIAHIGVSEINGEYAPHLHFQVINDMQGKKGDYPGVSSITDLAFYKNNCPDPNLILGLNSNAKVKNIALENAFNL